MRYIRLGLVVGLLTLPLLGAACDSGGGDETGSSTGDTGADTGATGDGTGADTGAAGDETGSDETGDTGATASGDATGGDETGDETGVDGTGDGTGDTGIDETGDDTGVDETGDATGIDETGDATGIDETGDTGVDETGDDTSVDGPQCSANGYSVAYETIAVEADGTMVYGALDQLSYPFNNLRVEFRPEGGPVKIGDYALEDQSYDDCTVCASMKTECNPNGPNDILCDDTMFATSGTLALSSIPAQTVTQTVPTVMAGGWPVASLPPEPTCVPEGTGNLVGHNIADYALVNCLGEPVSLHESCGQTKAVVLMSVAVWCTACTAVLKQFENTIGGTITSSSIQTLFPNTDFHIVLFENASGDQPTATTCKQYAASHNIDPSMVLLDWGGALRGKLTDVTFTSDYGDGDDGWCMEEMEFEGAMGIPIPLVNPVGYSIEGKGMATTWTYVNPYIAADAQGYVQTFTPWFAIFDAENMEYRWSSFKEPNVSFTEPLSALIY